MEAPEVGKGLQDRPLVGVSFFSKNRFKHPTSRICQTTALGTRRATSLSTSSSSPDATSLAAAPSNATSFEESLFPFEEIHAGSSLLGVLTAMRLTFPPHLRNSRFADFVTSLITACKINGAKTPPTITLLPEATLPPVTFPSLTLPALSPTWKWPARTPVWRRWQDNTLAAGFEERLQQRKSTVDEATSRWWTPAWSSLKIPSITLPSITLPGVKTEFPDVGTFPIRVDSDPNDKSVYVNLPSIVNVTSLRCDILEPMTPCFDKTVGFWTFLSKIRSEGAVTIDPITELPKFSANYLADPADAEDLRASFRHLMRSLHSSRDSLAPFLMASEDDECPRRSFRDDLDIAQSVSSILAPRGLPRDRNLPIDRGLLRERESFMPFASFPQTLPDPGDEAGVNGFLRDNVASMWHFAGSMRIGRAVDTDFRVPEVRNLAVIDSSVLPVHTRMNPTATVLAIARIAALRRALR